MFKLCKLHLPILCSGRIHLPTQDRLLTVPINDAEMIEEFVASLICANKNISAPSTVASAVINHPLSPAIDAAFAFVSVASALEEPTFQSTEENARYCSALYRATAIFIADIYALEKISGRSPTCKQVFKFWRKSGETFFSNAPLQKH